MFSLGGDAPGSPLCRTRQLPFEQLPTVSQFSICSQNSRRLIARMDHAICATRIASVAVFFPGRFFDEIFEGRVMFIGHQITRSLPAARVESGIAPSGAHHV